MLAAFANAFRSPDLRKKIFFTLDPCDLPTRFDNPDAECQRRAGEFLPQAGDHRRAARPVLPDQPVLRRCTPAAGDFRVGHHALHHGQHHLATADGGHPASGSAEEEGQAGQTKITQYTRYLTLVLAVLNSTAFVTVAVNDRLFTGCGLGLRQEHLPGRGHDPDDDSRHRRDHVAG